MQHYKLIGTEWVEQFEQEMLGKNDEALVYPKYRAPVAGECAEADYVRLDVKGPAIPAAAGLGDPNGGRPTAAQEVGQPPFEVIGKGSREGSGRPVGLNAHLAPVAGPVGIGIRYSNTPMAASRSRALRLMRKLHAATGGKPQHWLRNLKGPLPGRPVPRQRRPGSAARTASGLR
jgi:hypothetical protein